MFYDFLGFPKAQDFYNNFVTKRKPVVFQKGNAKCILSHQQWNEGGGGGL